jgi:elongation factor G
MMSIRATAPLAELSDYAGKLKSLTGGSGSYTLEFSHYQAVPFNIQQALAQEFKPKEEED